MTNAHFNEGSASIGGTTGLLPTSQKKPTSVSPPILDISPSERKSIKEAVLYLRQTKAQKQGPF
ncbi:hypothetical protein DN752_04885 [Echinicola strongylocentroti]|uniref:Uncharacterized protein n=1 Tax=Echinicola strongylocentroti TaxID=1795355 RepID=A0A2Z4IFQ0_9BACT|nr:hypothetical protein [Echinicola strongylocentroti]AWW29517.1 hypothetical protein DN752_04885 [Echinicola strongylocentroti]